MKLLSQIYTKSSRLWPWPYDSQLAPALQTGTAVCVRPPYGSVWTQLYPGHRTSACEEHNKYHNIILMGIIGISQPNIYYQRIKVGVYSLQVVGVVHILALSCVKLKVWVNCSISKHCWYIPVIA